ncbi:hypothetical protein NP233_g6915 [Leucocoprinus birnbaumii]|uniref:Uncharacterized protein n=1 Tax=Leucocoprinus birnbaumii TaxID=56174 RepID=A0AAD5VQC0_9AGAR|nr:hypothetical protein NP233_g6915 [Leucocoprinus birnbaumii]
MSESVPPFIIFPPLPAPSSLEFIGMTPDPAHHPSADTADTEEGNAAVVAENTECPPADQEVQAIAKTVISQELPVEQTVNADTTPHPVNDKEDKAVSDVRPVPIQKLQLPATAEGPLPTSTSAEPVQRSPCDPPASIVTQPAKHICTGPGRFSKAEEGVRKRVPVNDHYWNKSFGKEVVVGNRVMIDLTDSDEEHEVEEALGVEDIIMATAGRRL